MCRGNSSVLGRFLYWDMAIFITSKRPISYFENKRFALHCDNVNDATWETYARSVSINFVFKLLMLHYVFF